MIFWIIIAVTVVGFLLAYLSNYYDWCEAYAISLITAGAGIVVSSIMLIVILVNNLGIDGQVARLYERYDALTYQYENDIYENDNDIGKRELMTDIQKWNEDLAERRENQDDFWIGIFTPNIYDQFEFIEWEEE